MSIQPVAHEVRRLLSSDDSEVISITGSWGVGKTFAWNRYLQDAHAEHKIALKRYSYVSLFGINSLDELKYSIFENSLKSDDIGIEPSLKTLRTNVSWDRSRIRQRFRSFGEQRLGSLFPARR
jgi:hypothetical protein